MFFCITLSFLYCVFAFSLSNLKSTERSNEVTLHPQTRMDIEFHKVTSQTQIQNNTPFSEQTPAHRKQSTHTHIICAMMHTSHIVNNCKH
jgi:hypothetical protein